MIRIRQSSTLKKTFSKSFHHPKEIAAKVLNLLLNQRLRLIVGTQTMPLSEELRVSSLSVCRWNLSPIEGGNYQWTNAESR